ncbi:MAG: helix-turn-helix domain-containing protein [Zhenhengia sp.]
MKDLSKEFGINVRFYRKKLGLSQEELAFKCNIDRTTVVSIENGYSNTTLLTIANLAKALNIHPSKLFETD